MAVVPASGTDIRLLSGVPFSHDYAHTRWHDSLEEQTNWFVNRPVVHRMTEANFQRIEGKPYIRCDEEIDKLWNAKYIMFQNKAYSGKWFYAFVTKLEYVNPGRTNVHFELDVIQTWMDTIRGNVKPSMVLREHTNLWANDGQADMHTIDEGLDYGKDYHTVSVEKIEPYKQLQFMVIVTMKTMHDTDKKAKPMMNGLPQPLSFYIHPFYYENGKAPSINGKDPNNESGLSDLMQALRGFQTQESAQKNIVCMYVTPYIGYSFDWDGTDLKFSKDVFEHAKISDDKNENVRTLYLKSMPKYTNKLFELGDKYKNFTKSKESKLMMYPYKVITLMDFKGNSIDFKPEYINSTNLNLRVKGSIGTSNKISYAIDNYNNVFESDTMVTMGNEHCLIDNNPNDVPILGDMLSAYLQGNRNSLAVQENRIWTNGAIGLGSSLASFGYAKQVGAGAMQGNSALGGVSTLTNAYYDLQAMDAKKDDIANLPPSLQKMGSNVYYDYGNGYNGLYVVKKEIKPEYQKKLEDFFNAFGYKIHRVKKPNIHTRKSWNYVHTKGVNIGGNINNDDLGAIRKIFDNGITFWHTDDIGNYSLGNEVI